MNEPKTTQDVETQSEKQHKDDVATYFSQKTTFWEAVYNDCPDQAIDFYSLFMTRRKNAVLEMVDRYSGGRPLKVLDVGCGPGVIMEEIVKRGHRIAAMDYSEEMVRKTEEKARSYTPGTAFCFQGDIERIPLENAAVDIVLCLAVLPYLESDRKAIAEMARVVKPGGLVIVIITNMFKFPALLDPYYYLYRVWQYLWYHVCGKKAKSAEDQSADNFLLNKTFKIRLYLYGQLDSLFDEYNLQKIRVDGVGYGPLTFWQKEILPKRISLYLTDVLEKISTKKGFTWIKALAGQWVLCFEKK